MTLRLATLFIVVPLIAGCGSGFNSLKGKVTFNGEPVPLGEVMLMPDSAAGNKGPGVIAEIKNGQYETPSGKGHVGGAYVARITGFDGKPNTVPGVLHDYRGKPLFVDVVEKFELPASSSTRDFALTGKDKDKAK